MTLRGWVARLTSFGAGTVVCPGIVFQVAGNEAQREYDAIVNMPRRETSIGARIVLSGGYLGESYFEGAGVVPARHSATRPGSKITCRRRGGGLRTSTSRLSQHILSSVIVSEHSQLATPVGGMTFPATAA